MAAVSLEVSAKLRPEVNYWPRRSEMGVCIIYTLILIIELRTLAAYVSAVAVQYNMMQAVGRSLTLSFKWVVVLLPRNIAGYDQCL